MKKAFAILSTLALVLALGVVPLVGGAQVAPGEPPQGCTLRINMTFPRAGQDDLELARGTQVGPGLPYAGTGTGDEDWAVICMLHTVQYVTNWIFYIIMIVVGIMILYAAFIYLTSQGNPEGPQKANKLITYAIIGLVIALLARAIPAAVRYIIGM
ncbi:MAG TPA: hypothetical protein PKX21_01550 [Candidatus Pacearchaeota archaeon]|nr:hypothetical protein [Candidatus Pacearchaeota archaeon]HQO27727.1 hypothetical protein [Candidatus Pacearchaeota archaeon]